MPYCCAAKSMMKETGATQRAVECDIPMMVGNRELPLLASLLRLRDYLKAEAGGGSWATGAGIRDLCSGRSHDVKTFLCRAARTSTSPYLINLQLEIKVYIISLVGCSKSSMYN